MQVVRCSRVAAMIAAAGAILLACPLPAHAQPSSRGEVARQLSGLPLFKVLEEHYPETFAATVDAIQTGMSEGRTMREMQAVVRESYVKVVARQLPRAEGDLILRSVKITRDQTEALAASPADCMALLGYREFDHATQVVLPQALIDDEQAWATDMLLQTATRPVARNIKPPSDATIARIAVVAYDALSTNDVRRRISRLAGKFYGVSDVEDQRAICEFSIQFSQAILNLPSQEAVDSYLGLQSKQSP